MKPDDARFLQAIRGANVVAVFAGHVHCFHGRKDFVPPGIPIFYSGSSDRNTFLLVELGDTYVNVGVIDSKDGPAFHEETNPNNLRTEVYPRYRPSGTGSSWSIRGTMPRLESRFAPAFTEFNGKLYAAWVGHSEDVLYWSSFDGVFWSPGQKIPASATQDPPALAVYRGRLYALWNSHDRSGLYFATFGGESWDPDPVKVPKGKTRFGPAMAEHFGNCI
jgi:hypothetical protein